jgi:hypothetical protein
LHVIVAWCAPPVDAVLDRARIGRAGERRADAMAVEPALQAD